ncbi:hypothetical protein N7462_010817 [Penicillium macrosclerotiorum]|uniref:uncharacterized protein n=1 Tax=Penicillium macrosclerotiorum TaxID=303699 RepID=UPI00254880EC|nr:uncharacterized protein N7462_010817 [Penicillium macrosclerotiorum]KAJ5669747.1 hypothetical protein N7462_010817 [Penicillium macrosclerotiorum]
MGKLYDLLTHPHFPPFMNTISIIIHDLWFFRIHKRLARVESGLALLALEGKLEELEAVVDALANSFEDLVDSIEALENSQPPENGRQCVCVICQQEFGSSDNFEANENEKPTQPEEVVDGQNGKGVQEHSMNADVTKGV